MAGPRPSRVRTRWRSRRSQTGLRPAAAGIRHDRRVGAVFGFAAVAQLLAYHVAVEKGGDVDKSRKLATSVTVQ